MSKETPSTAVTSTPGLRLNAESSERLALNVLARSRTTTNGLDINASPLRLKRAAMHFRHHYHIDGTQPHGRYQIVFPAPCLCSAALPRSSGGKKRGPP